MSWNNTICNPPLELLEVEKICRSAWNYQLDDEKINIPLPYKYNTDTNKLYKIKEKINENGQKEEIPILIYNGFLNIVGVI